MAEVLLENLHEGIDARREKHGQDGIKPEQDAHGFGQPLTSMRRTVLGDVDQNSPK